MSTTLTVADYLKYANLQIAAEAFLADANGVLTGNLNQALVRGNFYASRFTATQVTEFLDQWKVVAQRPNTETGFSGTLFQARKDDPAAGIKAGDLVLSFRSTEFIRDAIRDSQATNTLEISNTGWAWGQITDMEAWYRQLNESGMLSDPDGEPARFSVTGYSLGGHLATAFNLLHGGESLYGVPRIKDVVTFNGAGVGDIETGTLRDALAYFNGLRANPGTMKDRLSLSIPELSAFYDQLRGNLASGVWDAQEGRDQLRSLPVPAASNNEIVASRLEQEKRPIDQALSEIIALQTERQRINGYTAGGDGPEAGVAISAFLAPASETPAETFDYRLAVILAGRRADATSLLGGAWQAVFGKDYGNPTLSNQWDLVGTETTGWPWSAVANSQVHHGTNVPVFIEDQPFRRGDMSDGDLLKSQFLKDHFDQNNFADTHSLVLIVDSLSVQNTLLQLLPESQRAGAQGTLTNLLKAASWHRQQSTIGTQGKAEGDVLENVVNALSDLFLGPDQAPLKGSLEGNTWADVGSTEGNSGRESLHQRLKEISDKAKSGGLNGQFELATPTTSLASSARSDFLAYAALCSLSPFVLKAPGLTAEEVKDVIGSQWGQRYDVWQTDADRSAQGESPLEVSEQWLMDRALLLDEKTKLNTINRDPSLGYGWAHLVDKKSGYEIVPDRDLEAAQEIAFGGDAADSLAGRGLSDHLYGGAGNDTLQGNGGDDHLEGNAGDDMLDGGIGDDTLAGGKGNDTLDGGDDDDTLVGGEGDDTLRGGKGFDTYHYRAGDGKDTIVETREGDSAGGRIVIERGPEIDMLAELLVKQGDQNLWSSADGSITLAQNSAWTLTFADGGSIQFGETQDDFESGDFGLHLFEEKATPTEFGHVILGDLEAVDFDSEKDGVQAHYDELGNPVVNPDKPHPGQADWLSGGAGNDHIQSLAGNDYIKATQGGNDLLEGGDGIDGITAGAGDDVLIGGEDSDNLLAGAGKDRLYGGSEAVSLDTALAAEDLPPTGLRGDWLDGGADDDLAIGGTGNDALNGGRGDDILVGGAGDDDLRGDFEADYVMPNWSVSRSIEVDADGDPILYYTYFNNVFNYGTTEGGDDVIYAGGGNDWVRGEFGNDYIDGGAGEDVLFGEEGNDDILGGDDDDVIIGDSASLPTEMHGNDYLDGEAGNDEISGMGGEDQLFGGEGDDLLSGGAGNDYLDGESGIDQLFGGKGVDQLFGGDGNDVLQGDFADAGDDYLDGEAGDDLLHGMGGRDELHGGEGDDQIAGDLGGYETDGDADTIYGGAGNDVIDAQAGDDIVDAGADDDYVFGRAGNDRLAGGGGIDELQGGEGDDTLDGGDGIDTLYGEIGNDTLIGGDGNDYLIGGLGNDILDGGAGNDVYYYVMGEGNDRIVDAAGNEDWLVLTDINWGSITLGVGSLKLTVPGGEIHLDDFDPDNPYGAGGIEYFAFAGGITMNKAQLINALGFKPIGTPEADELSGTALNDTITALAGNDAVDARAGNDTIYLDAGDDFADAGAGNDSVYGGDGADQIFGGEGGDTIYGGIGDDVLFGDAGDDRLNGDTGNDVLSGGAGNDQLDGGDGDDVFIFARGDGADVVIDGAGNNRVQLGSGLIADDVVFSHQGDDLVIAVKNTTDRLTVRNWFAADNHFAGLTLGDGTALDHAGVEAAMPTNQAPLLTADTATVIEDSWLAVSGNVLSNDADPEGRSLRVANAGTYAGAVGSLSLASSGAFAYTLANGSAAVQSLAAGQVLSESFAYTATDDDPNGAASAQSTIVIAVQGSNDLPILGADSAATSEDATAPLTGNVLANDRDIDQGTMLTVNNPGTRAGSYGSLTLAADGGFSYQLNNAAPAVQSLAAGQAVTDVFAQSISDGVAAVAGSLAITINGQNDAPIVTTPLVDQLVSPNTSWTWQLPAGSFADVDAGDALTYSASLVDGSVLPSWLSFSAETQTFSGRAPKSASGAIEISVGVADRLGATATDSFTLTFDASSGGGGSGGNGGGAGDNGGGSLANEGVGNGTDAPPPGHEMSFNDGAGTGPGDPGAMGGNGYRPKSRGELTMTDLHVSGPIEAPPVVSMIHGHSANAPGQAPSYEDGGSKLRLAAETSNDEVLAPNAEAAGDAETPLPVPETAGATGANDPLAAWLDALTPRSADEAQSANAPANGPAYAWGIVDAALLTHLATAYDDGAVLNPAGRPSLGQSFLATAEDPLALLTANASLQQFTGLKEGLNKLA